MQDLKSMRIRVVVLKHIERTGDKHIPRVTYKECATARDDYTYVRDKQLRRKRIQSRTNGVLTVKLSRIK